VGPAGGLEQTIMQLAQSEGKIAAIKHYRSVTGSGLAEAKNGVEAILRRHGASAGTGTRAGCASVLLLAVLGSWWLFA
jgi:hypothetical protein